MTELKHLLVVDDDLEIRTLLQTYLQQQGYRVTTMRDGTQLLRQVEALAIDLVILDVMLPGEDGLTLCRNLRASSEVPVLMLTARKDEMDRIIGLEMGADDYLAKPFNPRELLARIKVILRRTSGSYLPQKQPTSHYQFANWRLDPVAYILIDDQDVITPLSSHEFRLLLLFLQHPNQLLTRDRIMSLLQGREWEPSERSIDVQISRLRKRLQDDPNEPKLIRTVRGEGYIFVAKVNCDED